MRSRLAILCIFALILLAVPSLFACESCDGHTCITGLQTGFFCQFLIGGGCINDGFCPDGVLPLQAEYRVAAVRVLEPAAKALPPAQPKREPAPLLAAAK
jgi:hypothetical protein